MEIVINRQVKITASQEDWQLYDEPGVKEAVEELNRVLGQALSVSEARLINRQAINEVLEKHSDYGASDSEGFAFVRRCIRLVFGECTVF